jgi:hypothetical protein
VAERSSALLLHAVESLLNENERDIAAEGAARFCVRVRVFVWDVIGGVICCYAVWQSKLQCCKCNTAYMYVNSVCRMCALAAKYFFVFCTQLVLRYAKAWFAVRIAIHKRQRNSTHKQHASKASKRDIEYTCCIIVLNDSRATSTTI